MRIWFDTEFVEDGKTIELISIGLVREDGAMLYMETDTYEPWNAPQWIKDNVNPYLIGDTSSRTEIAERIVEFAGPDPEFWAYYASYDWVVLCQLYGAMVDLPKGWPMYCRDLKFVMDALDIKETPIVNSESHNALSDALWTMRTHQWILGEEQ